MAGVRTIYGANNHSAGTALRWRFLSMSGHIFALMNRRLLFLRRRIFGHSHKPNELPAKLVDSAVHDKREKLSLLPLVRVNSSLTALSAAGCSAYGEDDAIFLRAAFQASFRRAR